MSNETLRVLVGLDELFDVRISTLMEMDDSYPSIALTNGYLFRKSDDFSKLVPGLDMDRYLELYSKRNILHIANTRVTNLLYLLENMFKQAEVELQEKPFAFIKELWINVYPYALSEEHKQIAKSAIEMHLNLKLNIVFIYKSVEELTPAFIKANFNNVAMYDFNGWMTVHGTALADNPMPTVSFTVPALSLIGKDEDAVIEEPNKFKLNAFNLVKLTYLQHLDIEYDDVMTFCINMPVTAQR